MQGSIAILLAGLTRFGGLTSRPAVSFALSLACLLAVSTGSAANSQGMSVFDRPAILVQQLEALADMGQGRMNKAASAVEKLLADYPTVPENHLVAAILYGRQGNTDAARTAMEAAVDRGLTPFQVSEQAAALVQLGGDQWYRALLRRAEERAPSTTRAPDPAPIQGQEAIVAEDNTVWDPDALALRPAFTFPSPAFAARTPVESDDEAGRLLNDMVQNGQAAGNLGDIYINLDRGHSRILPKQFLQLAFVKFAEQVLVRNLDFGLNVFWSFPGPAFGNASVGMRGQSVARLALLDKIAINSLAHQYENNQIFVYPAVTDYAPLGVQDRFTANTPYLIATQGKSRSDKPVVKAIAYALAAMKVETKKFLVSNRLIAPTIQKLLRASQHGIKGRYDYLSEYAHPVAFNADDIDLLELIKMASALNKDQIPPVVSLNVAKVSGPGTFKFKTPAAVSLFIDSPSEELLTIAVEPSLSWPSKHLGVEFLAIVTEGNKKIINIEKPDAENKFFTIKIQPHRVRTSIVNPSISTKRVDIAIFAKIADRISAPAFVSIYYDQDL